MKGKELKNSEKTIELLDGKHNITIDFNAFQALEEIYEDMSIAFSKFNGKVKIVDIKNFLCSGINACIENPKEHYTPFQIGKLLNLSKLEIYISVLMELLNNAMPVAKEVNIEDQEKGKN